MADSTPLTPKPYPSWIVEEQLNSWRAPVDYPTDGAFYAWDEETVSWFEPELPPA